MDEAQRIARTLIRELRGQRDAELEQLSAQQQLQGSAITQRAAQSGTLYSTAPAAQQSRFFTEEILPRQAQARGRALVGEMGVRSNLQSVQREIDRQQRAAQELEGLTFDRLGLLGPGITDAPYTL